MSHLEHGELTAEEWDKKAAECRGRSRASFERSDTDGFLSQWASDLHAQLYEKRAEILRAGGELEFTVLQQGDLELKAKLMAGKYGMVWMLSREDEARIGRRFIPAGLKSKVQRDLGIREVRRKKAAWAKIIGAGKGKSGRAWVQIYRLDLKASDLFADKG